MFQWDKKRNCGLKQVLGVQGRITKTLPSVASNHSAERAGDGTHTDARGSMTL